MISARSTTSKSHDTTADDGRMFRLIPTERDRSVFSLIFASPSGMNWSSTASKLLGSSQPGDLSAADCVFNFLPSFLPSLCCSCLWMLTLDLSSIKLSIGVLAIPMLHVTLSRTPRAHFGSRMKLQAWFIIFRLTLKWTLKYSVWKEKSLHRSTDVAKKLDSALGRLYMHKFHQLQHELTQLTTTGPCWRTHLERQSCCHLSNFLFFQDGLWSAHNFCLQVRQNSISLRLAAVRCYCALVVLFMWHLELALWFYCFS